MVIVCYLSFWGTAFERTKDDNIIARRRRRRRCISYARDSTTFASGDRHKTVRKLKSSRQKRLLLTTGENAFKNAPVDSTKYVPPTRNPEANVVFFEPDFRSRSTHVWSYFIQAYRSGGNY